MFTTIIKFYFIFLCSIYIALKLMNHTLTTLFTKVFYFTFPLILAVFTNWLNIYQSNFTYIFPFTLLWISISAFINKPQLSFISTTIAFGISYTLHFLSSVLALILIYPIINNQTFLYPFLSILSSIFQLLLVFSLFLTKRFKRGMPFLFSTSAINIATILCLFLVAIPMYIPSKNLHIGLQLPSLLLLILTLAFLIHWWQAQITKSYKRSLEQRELESLRIELQEKDKTIAKLKAENVRLGDVTHEYNKLIPPLAEAVCEYLEGDFADAEMVRNKGQALSAQLRAQSEKLAQTTALVNAKKYQQHDSGIDNLNPYLNSFEKQAVSGNIEFSVHTAVNLREQLPKNLSVDDFVHLVVNLLSNAFIAVADCANPAVQLQFYQVGKHFVIEVSDNGIPFEIESLVNFGLERITTHADTGGSGVGLIAIWEIKEACGATLHIEEYASGVPFSKKISLIFNKKNLYSIRTWRKEEILQKSKRIDLQVYDFEK